jgi:hypothetical protein
MPAPKLERHCGSWVVVQRTTRDVVCETFSQSTADRIADNEPQFEVLTALQWLVEFNHRTQQA